MNVLRTTMSAETIAMRMRTVFLSARTTVADVRPIVVNVPRVIMSTRGEDAIPYGQERCPKNASA